MQGKDVLGASSKEDDWKRSGRETGKAGCRGFPVLERILVRPRQAVRYRGDRPRAFDGLSSLSMGTWPHEPVACGAK